MLPVGAELLLALRGGGLAFGGNCIKDRERPVRRSKLCCWVLLLFHSSLPVASWQGRVFFSCLSGQGINHPTLGGETGSSLAGSLPSSHNLPGHPRPASAGGHPPALLPAGAWPGCCPLSLMLAAPQFLVVGSGPCRCFIPSVVQLW